MVRRLALGRRTSPEATAVVPFSAEYAKGHRAFVAETLDSPEIVECFATSRTLPDNFGAALDERVVEYPWLLSRRPTGRVLDAGSTLNHAHILDRFLHLFTSLHIVTLAPEESAFTDRGVSYVYADLRDLPLRTGYYDTVVSISTLEHVGMDTTRYGARVGAEADPRPSLRAAVRELKRVLAAGGRLLITVPYGVPEDHGWLHQFDREGLDDLVADIDPREHDIAVYAYTADGWQSSSLPEAAGARYHDSTLHLRAAEEDLAAAARAVACIDARV
jgi:SAM-dependent methyltransferase